jgi:transcription initiation factor TFIID subunit 12
MDERGPLRRLVDIKLDVAREYTISDLLHKIDPSASIDPLAEELVLDIADDFIDSIVSLAAESARIRGSPTLQADDVNYVIQRKFGSLGIAHATGEIAHRPDFIPNEAHLKRLRAVQEAPLRQADAPQ